MVSHKVDAKSSCVYFVNEKYCTGINCVYTGIKMLDVISLINSPWALDFYNTERNISVVVNQSLFYNNNVSTLDEAAVVIKDKILSEGEGAGIVEGLDIVCVTRPAEIHTGFTDGYGLIYAGHGWDITLSGGYGPEYGLDYLRDAGQPGGNQGGDSDKAIIYHLCYNIALNVGACRQYDGYIDSKNCNIYSGKMIDQENQEIAWVLRYPIIMDNCLHCDYCINNCPRKAIHNKIDYTPTGLCDIEPEGLTSDKLELYQQYLLNARAVPGPIAYGEEGGGGSGEEVLGGRIFISSDDPSLDPDNNVTDFDLWFKLSDIEGI